jgi:hypothetical protein
MQRAAKSIPGFPDLLCVVCGQTYLVELKGLKGALTPDQIKFHDAWTGPPIYILRTEVDVISWVYRVRTRGMVGL